MKDASRLFYDTNTGEVLTDEDLARELEELKRENHEHDGWTLADYIYNCLTINNGTLEEL